MIIQRAAHLGFCFGVRDAIQLAFSQARREPLTILGELVHNESVLADLARLGIRTERELEAVNTRAVMVTAHGISDSRRARVLEQGHGLVEGTCPLVRAAHRALERLIEEGCHPVIIGVREHVEVRGMTEDLGSFDVILRPEDILRLSRRPRFGVVAQTTQPIDRVRSLVNRLRAHFPGSEVRWTDTVCRPTKLRQAAAADVARASDVVVVIGGAHSNNTRELLATCQQHCARVHHVTSPDDLQPDWFEAEDRVGLTAGTSTPDAMIEDVESRLHLLAAALACHASRELEPCMAT